MLKIIFLDLVHLVGKYEAVDLDRSDSVEFGDLKLMLKHLVKFVPFVFLSRGSHDLLLASARNLNLDEPGELPMRGGDLSRARGYKWQPSLYSFPVVSLGNDERLVNVSGAGDSASSGIIAGIVNCYTVSEAVYCGLKAAKLTCLSDKTISVELAKINLANVRETVARNKKNFKKFNL